jgi:hypothetical protein
MTRVKSRAAGSKFNSGGMTFPLRWQEPATRFFLEAQGADGKDEG